jgi:hypothetical protein
MNTPPPATFNGNPIPRADWNRFTTRDQATTICNLCEAAVAAIPGATIIVPLAIREASASDDFVLTPPLDPNNPLPGDIGDWWVEGNFAVGGGTATAADYDISEWAGILSDREIQPDMGSGDTNYQQVGHGANTVNVPVPGKIAFTLLPDEGLAEVHWVPA